MFERQQELERAQGYRGPATRFFGPLDQAPEVALVVRDMSAALLLIASILLVMSWRAGWAAFLLVSILALPALILLVTRSRVAAVLTAGGAVGLAIWALILQRTPGIWGLLIWLGVLAITQRAFRAAFKLHELVKAEGENRGAA